MEKQGILTPAESTKYKSEIQKVLSGLTVKQAKTILETFLHRIDEKAYIFPVKRVDKVLKSSKQK